MNNDQDLNIFNDTRFWVTQHFDLLFDLNGNKKRKCRFGDCEQVYTAKTSLNHLKTHWKRAHPDTLMPIGVRLHKNEWNHHLILFIIKTRKDFSFVENEYFIQFARSMCPTKAILSRRDVSTHIRSKCQELRPQIISKLSETICVSLTFDVWTASRSSRSFAGMTVHYIDRAMKLKSFVLEFKRLKYPHDTATLKEFLASAIREYGIQDKIVAITGDNASVNTSALRELTRELDLGRKFGLSDIQVRCIAHVINLAVKSGLEPLKESLEPVRRIVDVINGSVKRREKFETIQRELIEKSSSQDAGFVRFKKPYQLLEEIDTRWNSTYIMLERFAKLRAAIEESIQQMPELRDMEVDWPVIETLNQYLSPFYDLTKRYSASKYSTISFVRSSIPLIMRHAIKFQDDAIVGPSAMALYNKLYEYKSIMDSDVAELSTMLDPRFKLSCFQPESRERLKDKLRYYMNKLNTDQSCQTDSQMQSQSLEESIFDEIFVSRDQDEVEIYLSEPRTSNETDPLEWWSKSLATYPALSNLARQILCVQPTSVASEQTFSLAGLIDHPRRSSLSDESFESSVLLGSWIDILQ